MSIVLRDIRAAGRAEPPATAPVAAEVAADPVEGSVRWFDPVRGYGFVEMDAGGADVLLHVNVLRRFGQGSVADGSRIAMRVRRTQRGLQAVEVLAIDGGAAASVPAAATPDRVLPDAAETVYLPARVKWFDRERGFGFANAFDRPEDIFIARELLRQAGLEDLQSGEAIRLRAAEGERGLLAVELCRWASCDGRTADPDGDARKHADRAA